MTSTNTNTNTCATCKYVGTYKRPKIMAETGFGDQLMFDDAENDETVFMCKAFETQAVLGERIGPTRVVNEEELERGDDVPIILSVAFKTNVTGMKALCSHAGQEIGLVPITCEAWTAAAPMKSARLAELDRMIAEREARAAKRESK